MQVIKMRMRDKHQVNRRQVVDLNSRFSQPLQHEQPARKVGIDEDIFSADLQKEAGMPNKGHAHLPVGNEFGLMRLPLARSDRGVPDQLAKSSGSFAKSGILQGLFEHEKAST